MALRLRPGSGVKLQKLRLRRTGSRRLIARPERWVADSACRSTSSCCPSTCTVEKLKGKLRPLAADVCRQRPYVAETTTASSSTAAPQDDDEAGYTFNVDRCLDSFASSFGKFADAIVSAISAGGGGHDCLRVSASGPGGLQPCHDAGHGPQIPDDDESDT